MMFTIHHGGHQDQMVETWPGSHLSLREVQLAGQLRALSAHHILAALELHLQTIQLLCCEGGTGPLGTVEVQALGQDNFPNGPLGIYKDHEGSWVNSLDGLGHLCLFSSSSFLFFTGFHCVAQSDLELMA